MALSSGEQWMRGLEELRREAEDLQRRFEWGGGPDASYTAEDGSKSVRVTVDGRGRVSRVEVRRAWREAVGAEGLGAAVVEAASGATMQRLAAWGSAVAEARDEPAARSDGGRDAGRAMSDAQTQVPRAGGGDTSAATLEAMRQMLELLDRADAALAEFERVAAERVNQVIEVRSPGRHVTVALRAGQVTRVDIDQRWLRTGAHDLRIAAELKDAFQAAYDKNAETSPNALLNEGPLAELQELSRNPRELLRRAGFDTTP